MKYKVGDKVLIRKWDDMAAEYGIDKDGDIDMYPVVGKMSMKKYCGTVVTISGHYHGEYTIVGNEFCYWTNEMIERKVEEKMNGKFKVGDEIKIRGIIDKVDTLNQYRVINKVGNAEFRRWYHESDIELIDTESIFKLETGQVIETRNGKRFVFLDRPNGKRLMQLDDSRGWLDGEKYDHNLILKGSNEWDIVKVYAGGNSLNCCLNASELIWQRIEPKKMTVTEVEAALGYSVEIIKGDDRNE